MNNSINMDLKSFALALVASGLMLSFTAVPVEAATETVAFQSAELASRSGRAAVDARVEAAAERVCAAGGVDWRYPPEAQGYKACVKHSVASAQARIAAAKASTMVAAR